MTTSTTKHTASPEAVWNEDIAEAIHDSVRKHKGVPSYGTIARDLLAKFPVIAAAPELLEAAQEVETISQGLKLDAPMQNAIDKLWAAIAKAEGRTP